MNRLDAMVALRAENDALRAERDEFIAGWDRRRDLLVDTELLLREVMAVPEAFSYAPSIAGLLLRVREELGLDPEVTHDG